MAYAAAASDVLSTGRDRGIERAIVLSSDGGVLVDKSGNESSVQFNDYEIEMMAGTTLVHNHPNGTPLSGNDFVLSGTAELREIVAVTDDDGTYRGRVVAGPRVFHLAYPAANSAMFSDLSARVRRGEVSQEAAELVHYHAINMVLASLGLVEYSYNPGSRMRSAVSEFAKAGITIKDDLVNPVARATADAITEG